MGKLMSARTRGFESHSRRLKCGFCSKYYNDWPCHY